MAAPAVNQYVVGRPLVLGLAKVLLLAIAQLPLISAAPARFQPQVSETDPKSPDDPGLWLNLGIAAALVLCGGAFAGLTIALMGQDEVYLQVIKSSGEESERRNAASVLHLLQKGKHWVLVTLLLSNVITNETLPIVLDRSLGGGWPAVLGSTVLIVIFGEIVPQSICVRYGLPIGAWMAPAVLVLMYVMSPVAYPVAKLLDRLLGEDHGTIYKKAGLKTLVTLHRTLGHAGEQLTSDEVTIISAVLDLKEKSVGGIMTPMEDVFTMSADTVLDETTMDLILSQGYSRIPIHVPENPMNFVGMLLVKMLITYDPEDCKKVRDFALATLPETRPETSCLDIVNFFQEGKSHMVLVSDNPGEDHGALGVVTLEDVIEELIGEEIIDESDVFIDVHKAIRRMAPAPRSRVLKGRFVEESPQTLMVPEGELIDTTDQFNSPPSNTTDNVLRRSSIEAPPPRFQLRKQLTDRNADPSHGWITQRGATDEIREHLKHLGPSNLASRPRETRYQNVKIKRNSRSPNGSGLGDSDSTQTIIDPGITSAGYQGGIGAGILHSGGVDAKDGVHAVKLGYGAYGSADGLSKSTSAEQYKDLPSVAIPEVVHEEEDEAVANASQQRSNASAHSSDSQSSDRLRRTYLHRGPARSGSITEQIIDVNGVRKVILHTHSSASENESQEHSTNGRRHRHQHSADENTHQDESTKTTKKKRRKRRRGHGSHKSGEEQLLIPE